MRAVQRRANGLTGHYMTKAIGVDQNYGGVMPGEVGRVQRKLETFGEVRGLVFGAFGEVSEGVHELVQVITRMGNVGEGAGAAGKRRGNVIRWERRWEKEMEAEMVCERQGRRILKRGHIMLD